MINHIKEDRMVGMLAEIIALEYGVPPSMARQIRTAAFLHDIGKQRISHSILSKPGKLNTQEFDMIKMHTLLGAEMLTSIQGSLGVMARACCLFHHEWHNGGGYFGVRTEYLPFYVPFVAISDVWAALVCERPYKQAWPLNEAMHYIQNKAGTQFNPELVEVFLNLIRSDSRVSALFTRWG